jgi:thiol-disulfide isomerase/thioredoxin
VSARPVPTSASRRTASTRLVLACALVTGLFAVAGCGPASKPVAAANAAPVSAAADSASVSAANAAPVAVAANAAPVPVAAVAAAVPQSLTFTGKTLDGAAFDAATMAGKPTLLWFWAPWCATCASQASSIVDLKTQYGDRLAILGIAGLGDNKAMHEFVADLDVDTVPNLDDQAGELWRRFGITEQSTFVLIDRQGTIVNTGWLDDVDLTARVTALVG